MLNLAIFASGAGSNAQNLITYFENSNHIQISLLLTNNPNSGVIKMSKKYGIPLVIFNMEYYNSEEFLNELKNIDFIILAGFLKLIPKNIIQTFKDKIINIHPALLPNYGGKGMYGMNVHRKVKENNEKYSGITIHLVNEEYDKGKILEQKNVKIDEYDTPEMIQNKVLKLEHEYFPNTIEKYCLNFH